MNKINQYLKNDLLKYKNSLDLTVGLLTAITGLSALIAKISESKYTISLICIGVFFLARRIIKNIISSKRESFGVIINQYSDKQIKILKLSGVLTYFLLLYPAYAIASFFIPKSKPICANSTSDIGILITNFTNSTDDVFSYKLFNVIDCKF